MGTALWTAEVCLGIVSWWFFFIVILTGIDKSTSFNLSYCFSVSSSLLH